MFEIHKNGAHVFEIDIGACEFSLFGSGPKVESIVGAFVHDSLPRSDLFVSNTDSNLVLDVLFWKRDGVVNLNHKFEGSLAEVRLSKVDIFLGNVLDLQHRFLCLLSNDLEKDAAFPEGAHLRVFVHNCNCFTTDVKGSAVDVFPEETSVFASPRNLKLILG